MATSEKDPRHIITPFAFQVHPDLLGLPLATPRRRLMAMIIDLTLVSLISAISLKSSQGVAALAFLLSLVIFWLIVRIKTTGIFKKGFKYTGAVIATFWAFIFFVFVLELSRPGKTDISDWVTFSNNDEEIPSEVMSNMDWEAFAEDILEQTNRDEVTSDKVLESLERELDKAMQISYGSSAELEEFEFPTAQKDNLDALRRAIVQQDTAAYDSLRAKIVNVIARPELNEVKAQLNASESRIDSLSAKNEDLQEIVDNPGFLRTLKSLANDFGLTFGTFGLYFILSVLLLEGRTPGKKLTGIQVVRLNGKPMNFLYAFERFGGYAAGLATGTFGFFQMIWDPNRQAIHDKIAGTVVVDTRPSKIMKFNHLTQEIRDRENLLSTYIQE